MIKNMDSAFLTSPQPLSKACLSGDREMGKKGYQKRVRISLVFYQS